MNKELYEKQVNIERMKLTFFHAMFITLEMLFFFLTLQTLILTALLAAWAGESTEMKCVGMAITSLYFTFTCGLTIFFQGKAFDSRDDYMIAGCAKDGDVIWKYTSEILAERKIRARGITIEQSTEYSKSKGNRTEEQAKVAGGQSEP